MENNDIYENESELIATLNLVKNGLIKNHKKMLKNLDDRINSLSKKLYKKKPEDDSYDDDYYPWSHDGAGRPCVHCDDIKGWEKCDILFQNFTNEYYFIGDAVPEPLTGGSAPCTPDVQDDESTKQ
jgi:hypothetical protein